QQCARRCREGNSLSNPPPSRYKMALRPHPVGGASQAMQSDSVTVERFYTEHTSALDLRLTAGAGGLKRVIPEPTVNRPGLVLTGFTKYFAHKRVQTIGNAEAFYLKSLTPDERAQRYEIFFSQRIPCVVFSRNLKPDKQF